MTAVFGGTMINTLATPGLGAMKDNTGPGKVDDEGMEATGWEAATSMAIGGVDLPLITASTTTSTTFNDYGILAREGSS